MAAMHLHEWRAHIQLRGCSMLCQVAEGETAFKHAVLDAGGVEAVVRSMQV